MIHGPVYESYCQIAWYFSPADDRGRGILIIQVQSTYIGTLLSKHQVYHWKRCSNPGSLEYNKRSTHQQSTMQQIYYPPSSVDDLSRSTPHTTVDDRSRSTVGRDLLHLLLERLIEHLSTRRVVDYPRMSFMPNGRLLKENDCCASS